MMTASIENEKIVGYMEELIFCQIGERGLWRLPGAMMSN